MSRRGSKGGTSKRKRWHREHSSDLFVQKAQASGYRSRAAYKLLELEERHRLFKPGQVVLDVGAAPGSWSQVARERLGSRGRVVAVDILEMAPLAGVEVVMGDLREPETLAALGQVLDGPVDLVISDIAPNLTGIRVTDQAAMVTLANLVLEFVDGQLRPGGAMTIKVFEGESAGEIAAGLETRFGQCRRFKPEASRDRSAEFYWVAKGFGASPRGGRTDER